MITTKHTNTKKLGHGLSYLRQQSTGSAILELVGIAPVIVAITLLLTDIGLVIYGCNYNENACRDACRAAAATASSTAATTAAAGVLTAAYQGNVLIQGPSSSSGSYSVQYNGNPGNAMGSNLTEGTTTGNYLAQATTSNGVTTVSDVVPAVTVTTTSQILNVLPISLWGTQVVNGTSVVCKSTCTFPILNLDSLTSAYCGGTSSLNGPSPPSQSQ